MAANTFSRSERPTVTQRSSARNRHWPFRCCSSPYTDMDRQFRYGLELMLTGLGLRTTAR